MLEIKNLSISVSDKELINNLNLTINDGETHVIMGLNGAGKSSILKAIMNHPDYHKNGNISYNNDDITSLDTSEISKKGIFYLMQSPTEIAGIQNSEMLRCALGERGVNESIFEFNKRLNNACNTLSMDKSFIHRNINEHMSGGEKKKNEMLSLEILKPTLILLDELDSGLDVDSLKVLAKRINDYKKENNASLLLITHHSDILNYIDIDKVHILKNSTIIKSGDISLASYIEKHGFNKAIELYKDEVDE